MSSTIEPRIARLESDVNHLRADIADMSRDLKDGRRDVGALTVGQATLVERVSHLPTKGFIVLIVSTGASLIIAILTLLSRFGMLIPAGPK